ncbi:hypothetical protein D1871_22660 [Nakamurella silvestris]|nr:hypothetical protein D1871_22660 [Nakamurella silvestris]
MPWHLRLRIGVADVVDDEYDCLLDPLWNRLVQGATRASLSEHLWFEVQDHFGADPERWGTDRFAEKCDRPTRTLDCGCP